MTERSNKSHCSEQATRGSQWNPPNADGAVQGIIKNKVVKSSEQPMSDRDGTHVWIINDPWDWDSFSAG